MTIFDLFLDWPGIIEKMYVIASDREILDSLIEEQINKLICERHPDDCEKFIAAHADEINQIKRKLSNHYSKELIKYLNALKEKD